MSQDARIARRRNYVRYRFSQGGRCKLIHIPAGDRLADESTMAGYGDVLCGEVGMYIGPAEGDLMVEVAECVECIAIFKRGGQ